MYVDLPEAISIVPDDLKDSFAVKTDFTPFSASTVACVTTEDMMPAATASAALFNVNPGDPFLTEMAGVAAKGLRAMAEKAAAQRGFNKVQPLWLLPLRPLGTDGRRSSSTTLRITTACMDIIFRRI